MSLGDISYVQSQTWMGKGINFFFQKEKGLQQDGLC